MPDNMEEKFNYKEALAQLEAIAGKIESPDTSIDDIAGLVEKSSKLVTACREYLRTVREGIDALGNS